MRRSAVVTQTTLLSDLQSLVGTDCARAPDNGEFAVDGVRPQAFVEPGSYEEVAAVLRLANERGLAVIPMGGGWFILTGNVPRAYDIALSIRRLDKIIEHEPADMTVTCQAGISAGRLNAHLQRHGQMVPFIGASADDNMTIGGLLAMNHSFMPLPHGTPRDFTIGLRIVMADGRVTRAGGRVVKNVAGYDLCKLHLGAMGTLGVIVEATFKTFPAPQAQERRLLEFESIDGACELVFESERRGLCLGAAPIPRRGRVDGYILSVALAGSTAAVARSIHEIDAIAPNYGGKLFSLNASPTGEGSPESTPPGDPLCIQATVPRTKVVDLTKALEAEAPAPIFDPIDPALGRIIAVFLGLDEPEAVLRRLRTMTERLGGTLLVRTCDEDLKRRIDVFGDPPPAFELMRRVKQQFDPNGILSPGRFVGRL